MKAFVQSVVILVVAALLGYAAWSLASRPVDVTGDVRPVAVLDVPAESVRRIAIDVSAAERRTNPWPERNNEAVAALDEGDLDRAVTLLEECVAAAPGEAVYAKNLAEALARRAVRDHPLGDADRARALADLTRATELAPERAELASLLARWRAAAEVEADFAAYRSQHFELSFDGERHEILSGAQIAIDMLERAYGEFCELFAKDPLAGSNRKIRVVLTNREQFERSTGLGHWAGGAYDGTLRLPIEDFRGGRSGWSQVLRHELLHLFVHEIGGTNVPGWLNEGLAQWVEETRARDLENARRSLRGQPLLGLEDLSAPLARLADPAAIGKAYRQSLLFVDFLIREWGEWPVLQMVERAGRGTAPATTFHELTGVPLEDALRQFGERLR